MAFDGFWIDFEWLFDGFGSAFVYFCNQLKHIWSLFLCRMYQQQQIEEFPTPSTHRKQTLEMYLMNEFGWKQSTF